MNMAGMHGGASLFCAGEDCQKASEVSDRGMLYSTSSSQPARAEREPDGLAQEGHLRLWRLTQPRACACAPWRRIFGESTFGDGVRVWTALHCVESNGEGAHRQESKRKTGPRGAGGRGLHKFNGTCGSDVKWPG